jgi:hypothetical protein
VSRHGPLNRVLSRHAASLPETHMCVPEAGCLTHGVSQALAVGKACFQFARVLVAYTGGYNYEIKPRGMDVTKVWHPSTGCVSSGDPRNVPSFQTRPCLITHVRPVCTARNRINWCRPS